MNNHYTFGNKIDYEIVPYSKEYDNKIKEFDCGNSEINKTLKQDISDDIYSKTYLVIDKQENCVIGFVSLECSSIRHSYQDTIYSMSAVGIKYFAISNELHKLVYDVEDAHYYFSDKILGDVISKCYDISNDIIGARYILLYSVPDAVHFYERNGFSKFNEFMLKDKRRFTNDCVPMYMDISGTD